MTDAICARDFMVGNPVCAYMWQPLSSIRSCMLINSFSFLPVYVSSGNHTQWKLLSDRSIANYLRRAGGSSERNRRLARKLSEAVADGEIELTVAASCTPEDPVAVVLDLSRAEPVLVIGPNHELRGIITSFDLL